MDDVKNKIVNRIQDILQESHPNLLITPRIGEVIMMKFIDGSWTALRMSFLLSLTRMRRFRRFRTVICWILLSRDNRLRIRYHVK